MTINEIMTPNPQCVRPDAALTDVAKTMKELDVGMLPVCDNDRLVGTITDRDIITRAVANDRNPMTSFVRETMTPNMIYCYDDEDVVDAAILMESRQVRRLPVVNREKRLVGIVSLGDLATRTHRERLVGEVLESISEPVIAGD